MRRAARTDATAKNLITAAKHLGLGYVPLNGVVDGVLAYGPVQRLCDWKTPGEAALTEGQGRLLAQGILVAFVSTIPQLELLAAQMRWNGLRRYEAK
jgi:hypothetical protein